MDPEATLNLIVEAIEGADIDEAKSAIDDLVKWMRKGGFVPTVDAATLEFLLETLKDKI